MMQTVDPERFNAFVRLMAQPDPADLPRRAHVLHYPGDPDRRATRLPGILMAWLQRRYLDVDLDDPLKPAARVVAPRAIDAPPRLRLLRPTGSD
jgi:hypothetical protein